MVTHADTPMGRRLVQRLYRSDGIETILAVGRGAPPRSFDALLDREADRFSYWRIDLSEERACAEFFACDEVRGARVDTVMHVPYHEPTRREQDDASRPARQSLLHSLRSRPADPAGEAATVLRESLDSPSVCHLIAIGSAYVYRLVPGNANRLTETSELEFDPRASSELRSLVESDLTFQNEVHSDRLRVSLLRVPTVVTSEGDLLLHPFHSGPAWLQLRALGFDPLCPLISDHDVIRCVLLALAARQAGIFNVAGNEAVPLSHLARWSGRPSLPVPGTLLRVMERVARGVVGQPLAVSDNLQLRYGFTLDTRRARSELGFEPSYRIAQGPAGSAGAQIQAAPR